MKAASPHPPEHDEGEDGAVSPREQMDPVLAKNAASALAWRAFAETRGISAQLKAGYESLDRLVFAQKQLVQEVSGLHNVAAARGTALSRKAARERACGIGAAIVGCSTANTAAALLAAQAKPAAASSAAGRAGGGTQPLSSRRPSEPAATTARPTTSYCAGAGAGQAGGSPAAPSSPAAGLRHSLGGTLGSTGGGLGNTLGNASGLGNTGGSLGLGNSFGNASALGGAGAGLGNSVASRSSTLGRPATAPVSNMEPGHAAYAEHNASAQEKLVEIRQAHQDIQDAAGETHGLIGTLEALHGTLLRWNEDCTAFANDAPPEHLAMRGDGAVDPALCEAALDEARRAHETLANRLLANRRLADDAREIGHSGFIVSLAPAARWVAKAPKSMTSTRLTTAKPRDRWPAAE